MKKSKDGADRLGNRLLKVEFRAITPSSKGKEAGEVRDVHLQVKGKRSNKGSTDSVADAAGRSAQSSSRNRHHHGKAMHFQLSAPSPKLIELKT
jgi:hypothetical protein